MYIVLDAERRLLEACCKEATRAVNDRPLSARSWAWFHFLTQLVFTRSHRLSTVYDCNFFCVLHLCSCRLFVFVQSSPKLWLNFISTSNFLVLPSVL